MLNNKDGLQNDDNEQSEFNEWAERAIKAIEEIATELVNRPRAVINVEATALLEQAVASLTAKSEHL